MFDLEGYKATARGRILHIRREACLAPGAPSSVSCVHIYPIKPDQVKPHSYPLQAANLSNYNSVLGVSLLLAS